MDKENVVEILMRFRVSLEKRGIQVSEMILFGSYAQNTYREESDIDVIVISKSFSGKSLWERIGIITPSLREFTEPIEAVALTPDEWEREESLIVVCAKQGEVVYAA